MRTSLLLAFRYWKSLSLGLLITILCLIPASELNKLNIRITFGDIIVHFLIFMAFSFILATEIRKNDLRLPAVFVHLRAFAAGMALSIATEILQHWITVLNRTGSWYDLLFDLLGTATGLILVLIITRKSSPAI